MNHDPKKTTLQTTTPKTATTAAVIVGAAATKNPTFRTSHPSPRRYRCHHRSNRHTLDPDCSHSPITRAPSRPNHHHDADRIFVLRLIRSTSMSIATSCVAWWKFLDESVRRVTTKEQRAGILTNVHRTGDFRWHDDFFKGLNE